MTDLDVIDAAQEARLEFWAHFAKEELDAISEVSKGEAIGDLLRHTFLMGFDAALDKLGDADRLRSAIGESPEIEAAVGRCVAAIRTALAEGAA